jgi:hypothetical protein
MDSPMNAEAVRPPQRIAHPGLEDADRHRSAEKARVETACKPNFLIIGAVKAGTTSLHSYLSQHPEIFMPQRKELRYFAYDEENPYHVRARSTRVRTYDEYLSYFSSSSGRKAVGEASPNYLGSPGAAERIR